MPNRENDIEAMLSNKAELSQEERGRIWRSVHARMIQAPVPSPYTFILSYSKTMIPLVIALVVLLGAGGTVAASDNARPGDFLFPVDRVVEDARLALSSGERKNALKVQFTNERLHEFESVTHEALNDDVTGNVLTEAEADIFTNETIVKIEAGDKKAIFSTSATTREAIIQAVVDEYGFTTAEVDAVLVIETEDRASRPEDGAQVSEKGRARMQHALDVLSGFLIDVDGTASSTPEVANALRLIEGRLRDRASSLPGDFRTRIRGDEGRIELRGEDGRVRVEVKNGEVRVKTEDSDHSGRGSDDISSSTASTTPHDNNDDSDEDRVDDSSHDDDDSNDDRGEDENEDEDHSGRGGGE